MGTNRYTALLLSVALAMTSPPTAMAANDVASKFFDLEGQLDGAIDHARDAGNDFARVLAEQMKGVLEKWKETNKELLTTAFDRLDDTNKTLFLNIDQTLRNAGDFEKTTAPDSQRFAVGLAQVAKSLPGTGPAELYLYWPRVLVPRESGYAPMHMVGPKLSAASPFFFISRTFGKCPESHGPRTHRRHTQRLNTARDQSVCPCAVFIAIQCSAATTIRQSRSADRT